MESGLAHRNADAQRVFRFSADLPARTFFLFAGVVLGTGLLLRFGFRSYRAIARPVETVPFPADAPRLLVATRGCRVTFEEQSVVRP